ncbi:putative leader peptide [Parasphingorhabdus pacifica]
MRIGFAHPYSDGRLDHMGTTPPKLLLVTRRYVDLRRVSSALCLRTG